MKIPNFKPSLFLILSTFLIGSCHVYSMNTLKRGFEKVASYFKKSATQIKTEVGELSNKVDDLIRKEVSEYRNQQVERLKKEVTDLDVRKNSIFGQADQYTKQQAEDVFNAQKKNFTELAVNNVKINELNLKRQKLVQELPNLDSNVQEAVKKQLSDYDSQIVVLKNDNTLIAAQIGKNNSDIDNIAQTKLRESVVRQVEEAGAARRLVAKDVDNAIKESVQEAIARSDANLDDSLKNNFKKIADDRNNFQGDLISKKVSQSAIDRAKNEVFPIYNLINEYLDQSASKLKEYEKAKLMLQELDNRIAAADDKTALQTLRSEYQETLNRTFNEYQEAKGRLETQINSLKAKKSELLNPDININRVSSVASARASRFSSRSNKMVKAVSEIESDMVQVEQLRLRAKDMRDRAKKLTKSQREGFLKQADDLKVQADALIEKIENNKKLILDDEASVLRELSDAQAQLKRVSKKSPEEKTLLQKIKEYRELTAEYKNEVKAINKEISDWTKTINETISVISEGIQIVSRIKTAAKVGGAAAGLGGVGATIGLGVTSGGDGGGSGGQGKKQPDQNDQSSLDEQLMRAVTSNNVGVVGSLLQQGANVNLLTPEGDPLIVAAIKRRLVDMVRLLLAWNADVNAKDANGMSALLVAARMNYPRFIDLLVVRPNVDLNVQDNMGETALMYAVRANNYTIVYRLLSYGADKTIKNKGGMSALDIAQAMKNAQIISLLK